MTWTVSKCTVIGFGDHSDTLVFQLYMQWNGNQPVEVQTFEGTFGIEGKPQLWPFVRFPLGPQELGAHQSQCFYLPVSADHRMLTFLEDCRAGKSSVTFKVSGMLYWKAVEYRELKDGSGGLRVLGRPDVQNVQIDAVVPRDQWHALLENLGWGRFEVFELPLGPAKHRPELAEAVTRLHAAEAALRDGHYPAAITEVRKAFEAVGAATKVRRGLNDGANGIQALLEEAFPGEVGAARRNLVSGVLSGLRELRNDVGAHAGNLDAVATREDANVALAAGIVALNYLTRAGTFT